MAKVKTYPYDSADYLTSHEDIVFYVEDAFETQDASVIALALGVAVRARA
jgi:probable addiction module antidote protein